MSLLKLWNSIRGRSKKAPSSDESSDRATHVSAETPSSAHAPEVKSSFGFRLFGGGPHASLCKLLKTVDARIVLEISVGDGSRAIAMLEQLRRSRENIRYIAIDEFELAGGEVTLKAFHQTLRGHRIRPQVFPEPIDRGLLRVAHTVGCVDLLVIAAPMENWQTAAVFQQMSRIMHADTTVMYLDGETWQRFQLPIDESRQRAA